MKKTTDTGRTHTRVCKPCFLAVIRRNTTRRVGLNSSEAKASRVIICKFPVKLPFPVYSGLQRASTSRHIHSDGVPGWPAFHHVRMYRHVFALYSAALDSDERWLEARKRKDKATYVREKTLRSGERLN